MFPGRGRDEVDVAAHQVRDRVGRALVGDDFEIAHVAADRFHQQVPRRCGCGCRGAARSRSRPTSGPCAAVSTRSLPVLIGESGVDREHRVVVEERGDRGEVGVVQLARAGDVVGEQRRARDHEVVRIARVLLHIGVCDASRRRPRG